MARWLALVATGVVLSAASLCGPAHADLRPTRAPRRPVQIVKVVGKRGFSWRDAGIGAAAAGLVVAAGAAGGLLLLRTQQARPTNDRDVSATRASVEPRS
jgi:hypothetical protein